jgi:hypothetical protein
LLFVCEPVSLVPRKQGRLFLVDEAKHDDASTRVEQRGETGVEGWSVSDVTLVVRVARLRGTFRETSSVAQTLLAARLAIDDHGRMLVFLARKLASRPSARDTPWWRPHAGPRGETRRQDVGDDA